MWTVNFQMFKLNLERQRNQRSYCQHPLDHRKSKRVPEKHLLLLYWLCQSLWLCGSQLWLWKILKKMEYQTTWPASWEIYAGQEATVRTRHGTTDWFQIFQGCIMSLCLFNLYTDYIMQNAGLDKAQLGSRLQGEISITSDMRQPLWQKAKRN